MSSIVDWLVGHHSVYRYDGRVFAMDEKGRLMYEIDCNGKVRRSPRRAPPIKVNLPKLKEAILTSGHKESNVALRRAVRKYGCETAALGELWRIGWRPSSGASRVLNANINPYIR